MPAMLSREHPLAASSSSSWLGSPRGASKVWELPLVLALPGGGIASAQSCCPAGVCPRVPCSPQCCCLPGSALRLLPRLPRPSGCFCCVVCPELRPYENSDNYCVIKGTFLAEEDAGRTRSALPVFPDVAESGWRAAALVT